MTATPLTLSPNLLRFIAGRMLTSFAAQMQDIAVGWFVYSVTGSALSLGLVGLSQFAPLLVLAPLAGDIADRKDRRLIAALCNLGQFLCTIALFLVSYLKPDAVWAIYVCLAGLGVCRAFSQPALSSVLPNLVTKDQFPRAVALSSTSFQVATIAGPAAGGLLYALLGRGTFILAACLYLLAALAVFALPPVLAKASDEGLGTWQRMVAGAKYVFNNRIVLGALSLDLFAVLFGGVTALLPIYAQDILHVGPDGLGLLRGCPAIGGALMGLALAKTPLKSSVGKKMFLCVGGFGLATIIFALSSNLWLSIAALIALGAFDMVSMVVRQTLVQVATPDAMRGRVTAINFIFIGASNQLGEFESGVTAALFGTVPAALIGGLGTLAVVGLWAHWFPELRKADAV